MLQRLPIRFLLALVLLCTVAASARRVQADTALKVEYGWGERVRAGRWMPITVFVSDPKTREAVLELYAPQGGSYAMRVRQVFVLSPVETVLQLYVPMRFAGSDAPGVVIRDASSDKTLARYPEDPDSINFYQKFADAGRRFVGISGIRTTLLNQDNRLGDDPADFAYMPPDLLPTASVGYDGLDLLILNKPNVARLAPERQNAILEWVHSGGNVLLWPGDDPLPDKAPLAAALPCSIGTVKDYPLDPRDRAMIDDARPFTGLRGRVLAPRAGAEEARPFPNSDVRAYRARYGAGMIVVSPVDVGAFRYANQQEQSAVWNPLTRGMGLRSAELHDNAGVSTGYGADPVSQRQEVAVQRVQDVLGDVPGAGQFGFSYVAVVLIGMMVVVGPVDWFVLKRLGRQPWTWVTTTGWIALVTLGAIFIGHWFKSGQLYFRTMEVVDQVGDSTVGTTGITCIYSPRTTDYHLDAPPDPATDAGAAGAELPPQTDRPAPPGWWQPASGEQYFSRSGMKNDIDFHQTDTGNAPGREAGGMERPMVINIWNMRFLRCDTTKPDAPLLASTLSIGAPRRQIRLTLARTEKDTTWDADRAPRVVGSVTNLTDKTLTNIRIRTAQGFAVMDANVAPKKLDVPYGMAEAQTKEASARAVWPPLIARIGPHATVQVDAPLRGSGVLPQLEQNYQYQRYGYTAAPTDPDLVWLPASELAGRRAQVADVMVASGTAICLYAEVEDPAPPAVLREPGAIQKHYKLVRALFPIHPTTSKSLFK